MLNFKHKHVVQTRDPKLAFYSTTGDPIDNTKKIFARHILSMEIGEIKYRRIHTNKKAVAQKKKNKSFNFFLIYKKSLY